MTYRPVLRTQADLEAMWRRLMGPLGFGSHSLWIAMVEPDGRPVPHLTQVEGCHQPPCEEFVEGLAHVLREVGPSRVAFLRTRPGGGSPDLLDIAYARAVTAAAARAGVPLAPTHLAHDDGVLPITPDDLAASA